MNIVTLLFFLIWLGCGFLVVRFVVRTGGFTLIGRIAHWFGAAFVMIGLAIGMTWICAGIDHDFGARANAYVLTHQLRLGRTPQNIQLHSHDQLVTVYRPGSVNTQATIVQGNIELDERHTVRTSLWWMLWDTKFTNPIY
jgi:hypothetical protein